MHLYASTSRATLLPESQEEREWTEVSAEVRGFFEPTAVAVFGASRRRGTIGGDLFHNLLAYGFRGPVLPINPAATSVQGVAAYATLDDVPVRIDLGLIAVPALAVQDAVEQCARHGVKHIVVISAGFAEAGAQGRARQTALLELCRQHGIRLIGPNCMGIVNTDAAVRLSATFAPTPPKPGRLAFMSQSGALGVAIMNYSDRIGAGISTFVSVGNKADISGNDLIRYWAKDDSVDVILLYLESFGNPRKFSRIARRVGRTKPIVAVKSGRSAAGARAAGSHTGALIASSDSTVDALFRDAGVIRTDTLEQMFDVAALLAHQPLPAGRRVAIVTNAGGPGILCADACAAAGLEIPRLGETTRAGLRAVLAPEACVENPVDMIASADASRFRQGIGMVGSDPEVDALIVIYVPPLAEGAAEVGRAIVDATRDLEPAKPVLSVCMQSEGAAEALVAADLRIPSYAFPEGAALALARAADYAQWRGRPGSETTPAVVPHLHDAAAIVARNADRDGEWLEATDVWTVLRDAGLPLIEQRSSVAMTEVGTVARELSGRVALKASAPGLVHRSDAGAVRLDVDAADAAQIAADMDAVLRSRGIAPDSFTIQRMAARGTEMIVGAVHDAHFGPVLACGAGGTLVELLGDVSVRLAPVGERDARGMIEALRMYPALTGYRGAPPLDLDALVDVLLRVSALVDSLPEIGELDLNPVLVHERGASIVDARIRLRSTEPARR